MDSDNVVELSPKEDAPELLVGPFTSYSVKVDGRIIPRLTGWKEGDLVWLCVDGRFGQPFPKDYALGAATLIAQALAIGAGYSHLGALNKDAPFAPLGFAIDQSTG